MVNFVCSVCFPIHKIEICMAKISMLAHATAWEFTIKADNESASLWYINYYRGWWWGSGLMGYWAFLLLVCSIDHLSSRFLPHMSMRVRQKIGQLRLIRWIRRLLTMPALFNNRHKQRTFVGGIIPTRLESLILFFYLVFIILGESLNIYYWNGNTWYPTKRLQIARYVGDRSAVITCYIVIITFLFSGRNNFLLWLTGWKMSTFYTFHKWLGRMAVFSAFVHAITMFITYRWAHYIPMVKTMQWWRWGVVAMVCAAIMFFQSLPYLRLKIYDVFLIGHILLATFFLIGMWIHTTSAGQYAYACAAVWSFDTLLRLLRISSFGVRKAHLELVSNEMLVVTIPEAITLWSPKPGSFGYVYFLDNWLFFQSHPFSVIVEGDDIKFLIRPKAGITKRIVDKTREKPDYCRTVNILAEAFYGEYRTVYAYDQVIMVASGNGVIGCYEYIKDINNKMQQGISHTKYIKIYWIIRHWHSINWLYQELKKLQELDYVDVIIYVTRYSEYKFGDKLSYYLQNNSSISDEVQFEEIDITAEQLKMSTPPNELLARMKNDLPRIEFRDNRPDLNGLLHDDIQHAASDDNIAVISCALNVICDNVRQVVAHEITDPRFGLIDLIELLQAW